MGEPQLCYILDAILFLYGLVLTLLYCRLKIQVRKAAVAYEVRALLLGAEGSADSALRGLCLGVCGAWAGLSKLRGPPATARFLPAV